MKTIRIEHHRGHEIHVFDNGWHEVRVAGKFVMLYVAHDAMKQAKNFIKGVHNEVQYWTYKIAKKKRLDRSFSDLVPPTIANIHQRRGEIHWRFGIQGQLFPGDIADRRCRLDEDPIYKRWLAGQAIV